MACPGTASTTSSRSEGPPSIAPTHTFLAESGRTCFDIRAPVALLQAGVDLVTIRDQLGHVNVATTSRYATSNLELRRAALEAFWAATGMSPPARKRRQLTPKLSEFFRQI